MEQLFGILLQLQRGTPGYGEWMVACLQGAWAKLLGDKLAAVCRPRRFDDVELEVEILDADWKDAVRSVQPELLEKLRIATAGEVKRIKTVDCEG